MSTYTVETILRGYHVYQVSCSWTSVVAPSREWSFHKFYMFRTSISVISLRLLVLPHLRYSKKEQPLKGDHQALVAMKVLSKDIEGKMTPWVRCAKNACCVLWPRPQKFTEKTFVALHKFTKVFSLECFQLYGTLLVSCPSIYTGRR